MRAASLLATALVSGGILVAAGRAPLTFGAEPSDVAESRSDLSDALPHEEWKRVDDSVGRALKWLAGQQQSDGSFPTLDQAQPAVTCLCVMAFLSAGHQPGEGPYGEKLNRAVDFVLGCQQPSGMFSYLVPENSHVHQGASHTATYNHAIAEIGRAHV